MGRLLLPRAYRELLAMSQIVTDSDLEWTIARFTRPTDGPQRERSGTASSAATSSAPRSLAPTSPRSCSTTPAFIRAAPAISN
jgi:hypothetical protein